jgi:glycosyltransferase involved in cell wall biosynthesis
VIAGGGIDEDEFKDMAKGLRNIIFTGVVPYKDVAPLLALANVCVAPLPKVENVGWESYEAPVPIHLLEYMAAGKPIVGSDVHIVAELLSNGRGYLAEAENAEKLAEGIRYLLINKDIAIAMGKKAIDYIKRENSWSNQIEVVAGVLKSNGKASILE